MIPDTDSVPIIAPVKNHRAREKGVLVYPVYSRRSGGLSAGINLFPDKKYCSFDCPYCEVFPFAANAVFSSALMDRELRAAIAGAQERAIPVRDICFSGNGEPSLSGDFPEALQRAAAIRDAMAPGAKLVLITNGTGLLRPAIFELLRDAATGPLSLHIWLKLDAGTPEWYHQMSRSAVSFGELTGALKAFAARAPLTIQTMLCAIDGAPPPPEEARAWEALLVALATLAPEGGSTGVHTVHIYGKARPAPEDPKAESLPAAYLEERAASLRAALALAGSGADVPSVEVYP
jgi:histidinol dehydrogenase